MARDSNAIDFWRGFALVSIFVNHIYGNFYSRFTHANFSISDAAELFVFLAGWALCLLVGTDAGKTPTPYLVLRLGTRAIEIYAAQILITMLALTTLAATAIALDNPLFLEWHNAQAVFYDPLYSLIGLTALTYHLGYFSILPLYVVLMLIAPFVVLLDRHAPNMVLPASLALYLIVLAVPVSVRTWPIEGEWFFNPFAWQLVMVLGFVLAKEDGIGGFVRRHIGVVRLISIPVVVFGYLFVRYGWWPDPARVPHPRLWFIANKMYVTPIRLIQFLALVALFSLAFPYIKRFARGLADFLALLGRNSLMVFCTGSLLSLWGQVARHIYRDHLVGDTIVVIVGIMVMGIAAWLPEWRDRIRAQARAELRPPSPEGHREALRS
jgi:hypothetical protein